jgi:multiple sugar transport system ATP-binding protein
VGLRPEHLQVVAAGQGVPATVVLAEHLGDTSIVHLRVQGQDGLLNAKLGAEQGMGQTPLSAGQAVGLQADTRWALAFGADGRLLDTPAA